MLFIVSCRKSDIETPKEEKPTSIERFFNLPESANPKLKAIAQSIRMQEKEHPFLKDFIKRSGLPVWNKVKMMGSGSGNVASRSTSGGDSTTLVYIPFVQDSAITVNSVLAVKLDPADTAWRILYANNYESFGFDTTVNNTWNARNVFQFFALFEYEIFGHTKFLIEDERLFNTPTDSFTVTLKSINGVAINSRTTDEYTMTICTIQTICSPEPVAPPISTDQLVRTADNCYNTSTCNTYNWGNGGTDWTGGGWSPNNSGGGSGGSWGTTTDCMNTTTGTPIACSPGWVPTESYEPWPSEAAPATVNPLCASSFNFVCITSDCSYLSTNLMGMRFVHPNNPALINVFNCFIGVTNFVSDDVMNTPIYSFELSNTRTPLQFLNDFMQTRQLLTDGHIRRQLSPDGIMSYFFDTHAYSVIAAMCANMAADFTVFELGTTASQPNNNQARTVFRDHYSKIIKAFVPGSVVSGALNSPANSIAIYGTPATPCQ